jgi:hypothetical protein
LGYIQIKFGWLLTLTALGFSPIQIALILQDSYMSRTYRSLKLKKHRGPRRYGGLGRWQVDLNGHLVSSREEVRRLYRQSLAIPKPLRKEGGYSYSIPHNFTQEELDMMAFSSSAYMLHEHVFRNGVSHRQRINAIRRQRKLDNKTKRQRLKGELYRIVNEYYGEILTSPAYDLLVDISDQRSPFDHWGEP